MPIYTLKAGEEKEIKTSAFYLQIINAEAEFIVKAPELGGELAGETSKRFELPNINQVWFVNPSDSDIKIKYEVSNIKTEIADRGLVTIGNNVIVERINESINVDANATVENGKMAINVSTDFQEITDLNIASGETKLFCAARSAQNRKVTVQVITNDSELSTVRIGTKSTLAANEGITVRGNLYAIAGYEMDTEKAVYIRNTGASTATVAGGESWR